MFGWGKKKPSPPVEAKQVEVEERLEEQEAVTSPFKNTERKQQEFAAQVREESEKLKGKLELAKVKPARKDVFNEEQLAEIRRKLSQYIAYLETNTVTNIDTRDLDRDLAFFVESLEEALRDGNADTAERILKGIQYGIVRGHEEIKDYDMIQMDDIMEARRSRLGQYKELVILSKKIDEHQKSNAIRQKKYELAKEGYQFEKEKVIKKANEHPDLVAEIDEVGADKTELLSPEAFELVTQQNNVIHLLEQVKNLKQAISLAMGNINALTESIRTLEANLANQASKLDQQTLAMLKEINEQHQKQLLDLRGEMLTLDEMSKDAQAAMDLIFSSPEMKNYVIESQMRWERLIKEEDKKKIKEKEGKILLLRKEIERKKNAQVMDEELARLQEELEQLVAENETLEHGNEEPLLINK